MGRRAARRRHRRKYKARQSYHSDPEDRHKPQESSNRKTSRNEKWGSFDDLIALDYAENVTRDDYSPVCDEIEVAKRLSSLNVSVMSCGNDPLMLPDGVVVTSDVDTIYSELPSATHIDNLPGELVPLDRLKERQCRKRSSKRNRKRMKKAKALPPGCCSAEDAMAFCIGKHKRSSYASKLRFNPIAWVHPVGESTNKHSGGQPEAPVLSDNASSRALTDSDSPIVDDIIMIDSDEYGEREDEEAG